MGYPLNPPPYPVIEKDPSMKQILLGFRKRDWGIVALSAGVSAPYGYMIGRPVVVIPSMWFAVGIGTLGGFFLGMQTSFCRLTGYEENSLELARMGKQTAADAVPRELHAASRVSSQ